MSRWEPNARARLEQAALELYRERGYEGTTVAEIARHAGLTERTFFRHFADKREVLFGGTDALRDVLVRTLAGAPASSAPIDAVGEALTAAARLLEERRAPARRRQQVVAANPVLQERELIKLAALAAAMAAALRERGVDEPVASVTAEAGIAVFRVAFERWIDDPDDRPFVEAMRESLAALRAAAAGR